MSNAGYSGAHDGYHNYSIVSHVAGGGAEVDDGSGGGAAVCEGVDVSHDVVPELALLLSRHGEVDVLLVALHLLDLGVRDGQTQILRRTAMKTERGGTERRGEFDNFGSN